MPEWFSPPNLFQIGLHWNCWIEFKMGLCHVGCERGAQERREKKNWFSSAPESTIIHLEMSIDKTKQKRAKKWENDKEGDRTLASEDNA